jgi:hypothetical protein
MIQNQTLDLPSLVARILVLERQNRLFKRVGVILLISIAAFVFIAQARPPRTLEAEQFILRDAQGRERLAIGTPRVSGVALDLAPDDAAVWISGNNGVDRAILTNEGLRFADDKGRPLESYLANPRPASTR